LVLGFYDIICIVELQSEDTCTKSGEATECTPNAVCYGDSSLLTCTCNTGFYDNNFSTTGGLCVAGTYFSDEDNCIM
jgi:hypothetical protein